KGQISVIERALWRWAKPEVPVEAIGHRLCLLRPLNSLWPIRPARPVDDLPHRTDGAIPNPFAKESRGFRGLVAHDDLRGDTRFARHFGHATRFINCSRHRLL